MRKIHICQIRVHKGADIRGKYFAIASGTMKEVKGIVASLRGKLNTPGTQFWDASHVYVSHRPISIIASHPPQRGRINHWYNKRLV